MRNIILLLLLVGSIGAYAQPDQEEIAGAIVEVADGAQLIAITADVMDDTFSSIDRIQRINQEMARITTELGSPANFKFISPYTRNATLGTIRIQARQLEVYARTLANVIRSVSSITVQIGLINRATTKVQVDKALAAIRAVAGGTTIAGFEFGGNADANSVAQLKDNLNSNKRYAVQNQILSFLTTLDGFNRSISVLENEVYRLAGKVRNSFGVGVLFHGSSGNLHTYIVQRNSRIESAAALAWGQQQRQMSITKGEIDRLMSEFRFHVKARPELLNRTPTSSN